MDDKALTSAEAAKLLGIAPGSLDNMRSKGKGGPRYFKVGRLVRYLKSDVLEFIKQRTVDPAVPVKQEPDERQDDLPLIIDLSDELD